MSAFVVDNSTINRVVNLVLNWNEYGHKVVGMFAGLDSNDTDNANAIGQALYALNIKAMNGRYRENNPTPLYTFSWTTGWIEGKPHTLDARCADYKALTCLIYQCSEEPADKDPLYHELEQLRDRLAHYIVCSLPEYEQANTWR